jgi:antitoxin (DNA-binding transcriptional repressor) of toxin-antitoxin stability system
MDIKAVGVKVLRDNLSRYLKEVKTGTRILVLDREEVVAEIHEPSVRYPIKAGPDAAEEMVKAGKLLRPKGKRIRCSLSPVRLPEGSAGKIIDETRAESGDSLY